MRTSKEELISNELKPIICQKIKDARIKFGYSLEDLAKALNYQKNRQTLHKYENGTLNIPITFYLKYVAFLTSKILILVICLLTKKLKINSSINLLKIT